MSFTRRDAVRMIAGAGALAVRGAGGRVLAAAPEGWRAGFANAPAQLGAELRPLFGKVPAGLSGVLYRAGPGQFERGGERIGHWFDGDGMIQRFHIAGGRVRHRGRFVATTKRLDEEAAGHFKYGGYGFAPKTPAAFSRPDEINAANTNVLPLGREIWALWEGGSPWRLDADLLETLGRQAFPGAADGLVFSAHPRIEPGGDIWNFGGFGSRCVLWRLGNDGALKKVEPFPLPRSTLMHDFAVTERHIVLLAPPMIEASRPARSLIERFDWRADEPLLAIVIDTNDFSLRRVHELPAHFLYHIGNAWEDSAGTIRLDACLSEDVDFAVRVARLLPSGTFEEPPYAKPTLITLHADGRASLETMPGRGEFPRVDPRRIGQRHRYTYGHSADGLVRWNWDGGEATHASYGRDYWPEEPVFVPRSASSREDDGWLLATRLNLASARTELLVFDARRLSEGPLAAFACPYAIPLGFHGSFVRAA